MQYTYVHIHLSKLNPPDLPCLPSQPHDVDAYLVDQVIMEAMTVEQFGAARVIKLGISFVAIAQV